MRAYGIVHIFLGEEFPLGSFFEATNLDFWLNLTLLVLAACELTCLQSVNLTAQCTLLGALLFDESDNCNGVLFTILCKSSRRNMPSAFCPSGWGIYYQALMLLQISRTNRNRVNPNAPIMVEKVSKSSQLAKNVS